MPFPKIQKATVILRTVIIQLFFIIYFCGFFLLIIEIIPLSIMIYMHLNVMIMSVFKIHNSTEKE